MTTANKLVDFLIIGAGKSGTTSLYYYLAQHPGIFLPRLKEPEYFLLPGLDVDTTDAQRASFAVTNPNSVGSRDHYLELFRDARSDQLRGEASIHYLLSTTAAENIGRYTPSVKLICVLRNPIERAFSNFSHGRRDRLDDRASILDALDQDGPDHPYFFGGFYGAQLECYRRVAPNNPLRIFLYEELVADAVGMVREIFKFLGVDPEFTPDTGFKANVSGEPAAGNLWAKFYDWAGRSRLRRHPVAQLFLTAKVKQKIVRFLAPRAFAGRVKSRISPAEWQALRALYEQDIKKLEGILCRDMSHWLQYPYQ
jgi:hypothetical protein